MDVITIRQPKAGAVAFGVASAANTIAWRSGLKDTLTPKTKRWAPKEAALNGNPLTDKNLTKQTKIAAVAFQLGGLHFAINLQIVVRSSRQYADIHYFGDGTGFTFVGNRLVKVLDLAALIFNEYSAGAATAALQAEPNGARLLDLRHNGTSVGVLVDGLLAEPHILQLTDTARRAAARLAPQINCVAAAVPQGNSNVLLLDEDTLFKEINKHITYNDVTGNNKC